MKTEFTVTMEYWEMKDENGKDTGERELWVQWTPQSGDPKDTSEYLFLLESLIGKDFDSGMMMQPPFTRDWCIPLPNDDTPLKDTGITGREKATINHLLDPDNHPDPDPEDY